MYGWIYCIIYRPAAAPIPEILTALSHFKSFLFLLMIIMIEFRFLQGLGGGPLSLTEYSCGTDKK